jgi:aminomethyltransferase
LGRQTPLFELHVGLGAKMVDFGGWDMPLNYGSQIEEHHAVRRAAGVFDVSHMCVADTSGARSEEFLRQLLANDVARLTDVGQALYSCMLNPAGGILDDLIVYRRHAGQFRLVVNAGTRDKDLAWMRAAAGPFDVQINERSDLAMLAVQGPQARAQLAALLPAAAADAALALPGFCGTQDGEWFIARTGYTGEDGFEVMLPNGAAAGLWQQLNARGVRSCGLGARDTLRLEAGMNLYGSDMTESTHPLESGLGWTIAWNPPQRQFTGRAALEPIRRNGSPRRLVGLVLEERAVMRSHQSVTVPGVGAGEITSGSFSPTMGCSIALARVPAATGATVTVDVRGKPLPARVLKPPFVRHGQVLVPLENQQQGQGAAVHE